MSYSVLYCTSISILHCLVLLYYNVLSHHHIIALYNFALLEFKGVVYGFVWAHGSQIWMIARWNDHAYVIYGVSKNRGTPKWMISGYPYFRKHPYIYILIYILYTLYNLRSPSGTICYLLPLFSFYEGNPPPSCVTLNLSASTAPLCGASSTVSIICTQRSGYGSLSKRKWHAWIPNSGWAAKLDHCHQKIRHIQNLIKEIRWLIF